MAARVIIADDNPVFRDVLKYILMDSNMEIIAETDNGMDTIEQAEKLEPDLLLLDISMPNLDGIEVLQALRKSHSDLKIIILTMHKGLSGQVFKLGANGCCIKDCKPKKLLECIEKVLSGKPLFALHKIIPAFRKISHFPMIF